MNKFNNNLSKLTSHSSTNLKKVVLTAFASITLTLGLGAATSAESNLTTVYYVYMNGQYIGTVSDKDIVEDVINKKLDSSEDTYNRSLHLSVGSDLTYIPEQVFRTVSKTDDINVIQKLEDQLAIEADASAVMIDGKAAVYVKDKAAAEQVVKALKLKYVTAEQLAELEAQQADPTIVLPALQENETRLLDVQLSKEVSIVEEKISPKEILTVEQAVDYLLKGTLEEKKYNVQEGDVLGKIANNHGMKLAELLSINPELTEESVLKIDQEINITMLQPIVDVIVEKEVFRKEEVAYQKEVVEDASMLKGDTKVKQEGKNGLREVTYKISEQNGVKVNSEVVTEQVLEAPVSHIVLKGTKVIPSRGDGNFIWPTVGGYVSSKQGTRWGKFHKGIDIARPSDRTIKAADNGKVVSVGWDGGYGNKIVIDHQNGYRTVYAHLSSTSVKVGQTVPKGSKIGVMGSTGRSTGVHLHFEIYKNGKLENPLKYIR